MNAGSARSAVLVHGGFVDGSGWQGVYDLLKQDGYNVAVVQNPTLSLEGDVAATRQVIDAQDGPVVLVGHSYGGAVITEAGTDPNVAALVYIAAFAPDAGESVNTANTITLDAPGGVMNNRAEFCWPPRVGATVMLSGLHLETERRSWRAGRLCIPSTRHTKLQVSRRVGITGGHPIGDYTAPAYRARSASTSRSVVCSRCRGSSARTAGAARSSAAANPATATVAGVRSSAS
jgi:pimeloyl-ACP methyl ester carboxylesterase